MDPDLFKRALEEEVDKANAGVTHADFVAGVRAGELGFKCVFGEPIRLVSGVLKVVFSCFVLAYVLGPLILVPLWSYSEGNPWLLVGILVSYFGSYSGAWKSKLFFLLLMLAIGNWIATGFSIHQYITFIFFCFGWGYVFFQIAEESQRTYALQKLMEDPELFERAVASRYIMVVRKADG
jgi:hypothetical protein